MFDGSTEVDADIQLMSGPSDLDDGVPVSFIAISTSNFLAIGGVYATGMPPPSWQLFVIQSRPCAMISRTESLT